MDHLVHCEPLGRDLEGEHESQGLQDAVLGEELFDFVDVPVADGLAQLEGLLAVILVFPVPILEELEQSLPLGPEDEQSMRRPYIGR